MTLILLVASVILGGTTPSEAVLVTAYHHEMHIFGSFGSQIDPTISNLPDSTYPFPQVRGGSFDGTFVYDSMAQAQPDHGAYEYTSVNVNILNNVGVTINTITTSPNNFYAVPNGLGLTFGPSAGVVNALEDLRIEFNGTFTIALPPPPPELPNGWGGLNVGTVVPPPPNEWVAATLKFGFLETDGAAAFTFWDLPVTTATITHVASTPYLREVPDTGDTIWLLGFGLMSLLAAARSCGGSALKRLRRR